MFITVPEERFASIFDAEEATHEMSKKQATIGSVCSLLPFGFWLALQFGLQTSELYVRSNRQSTPCFLLNSLFSLKMESIRFSEKSVNYQTTLHYNSKYHRLHIHRCDRLKSKKPI
jgi:hypothetical protein